MNTDSEIVLIGLFMIIVGGSVVVLYDNATRQIGEASIVSGNTWHGGDLRTFFNATLSFQGHTTTVIFTCDYYHVGDKVSVSWGPLGGWNIYKPTGCF